MVFKVGDLVDVLDKQDNLWSAAVVTSVQKDFKYNIKYIGWGDEFNEVVSMSSGRLINGGTYVNRVKSWAKLTHQLVWWPCILYIRKPAGELGIENLREETKVFVQPCGQNAAPLKPFFHGVWKNATRVSPFATRFDIRYDAGMSESKISKNFQQAVDQLNRSDALSFNFKFIGSYEYLGGESSSNKQKRDEGKDLDVNASAIGKNGAAITDPFIRVIQSKSHLVQAIRHQFEEDPWGVKPDNPEVNFNIRDYFSAKAYEGDPAISIVLDQSDSKKRKHSEGDPPKDLRKATVVRRVVPT